jgi:hypothetical protein
MLGLIQQYGDGSVPELQTCYLDEGGVKPHQILEYKSRMMDM